MVVAINFGILFRNYLIFSILFHFCFYFFKLLQIWHIVIMNKYGISLDCFSCHKHLQNGHKISDDLIYRIFKLVIPWKYFDYCFNEEFTFWDLIMDQISAMINTFKICHVKASSVSSMMIYRISNEELHKVCNF